MKFAKAIKYTSMYISIHVADLQVKVRTERQKVEENGGEMSPPPKPPPSLSNKFL